MKRWNTLGRFLTAVALLSCSGCGVIAWLATLAPPDPVPAEFEMPEDQTVLVLVDDFKASIRPLGIPLERELTREINKLITVKDADDKSICKETIPYKRIIHFRASHINFHSMSIAEVGEKLEADLVLYIRVEEFSIKDTPHDPIYRGRLRVACKVFDVKEKEKLWPEAVDLFDVDPIVIPRQESDGSRDFARKFARGMIIQMAEDVSNLFRESPGEEHGTLPGVDPTVEDS